MVTIFQQTKETLAVIIAVLRAVDEYRNKLERKSKRTHRTSSGTNSEVQAIFDKMNGIPAQLFLETINASELNKGDTFHIPNDVTIHTCCISADGASVLRYYVKDGLIYELQAGEQVVLERRAKISPNTSGKKTGRPSDEDDDYEDGPRY